MGREPQTASDLAAVEWAAERHRALTAGEEPEDERPTEQELAWEERDRW